MNKQNTLFKANFQRIIAVLLLVLVIGIITLLLPAERKFKLEFQKGKLWMHDDLFAPFDFALYKTSDELQKERDSLKSNFVNYFRLHNDIYLKQKEKFTIAFYTYINANNKTIIEQTDSSFSEYKYYTFGLKILHNIYTQGIIDNNDKIGELGKINLIRNKFVDEIRVDRLYSITAAKVEIAEIISSNALKDSNYLTLQKNVPLRAFITPNIRYDKVFSKDQEAKMIQALSQARGMIASGTKIVSNGEIVDDAIYHMLYSLKKEYEMSNIKDKELYFIYIGQIILLLFLFLLLTLFIYNNQMEILSNNKSTSFILLVVVFFVALASVISRFSQLSIYIVPFIVIPILIKTFFNHRVAIFTYIVSILIIAFLAPNSFEFAFINIVTGVIAMYSIRNNYKRSSLFWTALISLATYSIVYLGIALMQEGSLKAINYEHFIWFGWNSLLLLTVYPFIYIFEKLFGYVSDLTLIELSDTNNPLLRELSEKAPGTFQHSLMVSNLVEFAVSKIKGKTLLAKVGALYHDIGKAENAMYFTENQKNNDNPHSQLEPEESAKLIINHVLLGEKKARKAKLPQEIIDFIMTHHGTSKVRYFLHAYQTQHKDEQINEENFKYPAYKPHTKELAVMMMSDSIEAAARSLTDYSQQTLSKLVNSIIDRIIDERQLDDVEITFKDLTILRIAFVEKLMSIYHARIVYPELVKK
ncbi:MAG: HDIG domain-containing protein [Bacteroidales bacterium]|nr:HDIG domain-containing protein [Bacteroidales bacterium]